MMGFTFTTTRHLVYGGIRAVYGTFTNTGGSTGGTIATGLRTVENFDIQYIKNAVVSDAAVVNATLTTIGGKQVIEAGSPAGNIVIVTVADTVGFWYAVGE
jgi:hypothetical protein